MNIDWAIPCRYVEVNDNLGTIIGAGVDTTWVLELPAPLVVVVAIRLLAMAEELDGGDEHTATNRVRDPHGDVISELSFPFGFSGESAKPEWLTGIMVSSVVQFEATEEGTYTIEHEVDASAKEFPMHVVLGQPPVIELPAARGLSRPLDRLDTQQAHETALRGRSRSPDLGTAGPSYSGRRFRLLLAPNTLRKQARTSVIDGEVFCGPPVRTPRSKSRRTNQARALLPPIRRRLSPPAPNGRTMTSQGSASGRFTRAIGQRKARLQVSRSSGPYAG